MQPRVLRLRCALLGMTLSLQFDGENKGNRKGMRALVVAHPSDNHPANEDLFAGPGRQVRREGEVPGYR